MVPRKPCQVRDAQGMRQTHSMGSRVALESRAELMYETEPLDLHGLDQSLLEAGKPNVAVNRIPNIHHLAFRTCIHAETAPIVFCPLERVFKGCKGSIIFSQFLPGSKQVRVLRGFSRRAIFSLPEVVVMSTVDLHMHSTASDGTRSPSELVEMSLKNSLSAVSVTDHDTLDGIPEAAEAAAEESILLIPGVELSVELGRNGLSAHLLGYFPGAEAKSLTDRETPLGRAITYIQGGRARRNLLIMEKLCGLGISLFQKDLEDISGGDVIGRPHIAEVMVNSGYVGSTREAFNRFLGKGRPAYVERDRLGVAEAVRLILDMGGLPVMAHPGYIGLCSDTLGDFFADMRRLGVIGIEAYYPTHTPSMVALLESIAAELRLLLTGGTDYHGREGETVFPGGSEDGFRVDTRQVSDFMEICMDSARR